MGLTSTLINNLLNLRAEAPAEDPAYNERIWSSAVAFRSSSGVIITPDTAFNIAGVWSANKVITEDIAKLPCILYERLPVGKRRADEEGLYDVLHNSPNNFQTSFEFFEMMTSFALMRGNAYARILPGPRGRIDQLIPIHPDRVTPSIAKDLTLYYKVREGNLEKVYFPDELFHLRGLSLDGISGVSVITYARNSLGLVAAAEQFGSTLFNRKAMPGGVIKHKSELSAPALRRIRDDFEAVHSGLDNAHSVVVLEEGMDWQTIAMTNEDAQFLETRKFQLAEIARWFRVPAHKIGDLEHATFSNVEHISLEYGGDTLLPWARRWELAIARSLIEDRRTHVAEFLFDAIYRTDLLTRMQAYQIAIMNGINSRNEVRAKENENPVEGGDEFLIPMNLAQASQLGQTQQNIRNATGAMVPNGRH